MHPNSGQPTQLKPLIAIVGPTAVGKTDVAIQLAARMNGEIVSADSRLLYRGMDIGTAKPTPAERAHIPHHLIDVAEPDQVWSLALFQHAATQAIADIHNRDRQPFLVGGTGQYIRAVLEGWEIPKVEPNPLLRTALENWADQIGSHELHTRLVTLDEKAAAQIDHRNVRRLIRALEVILSTGQRFSTQKRRKPPAFQTLILGLTRPRPELYARVDARIEAMLEAGFVDEVRELLARGHSPDLSTLSAIGYGEIISYLHEAISLEEAAVLIKRRTRIFVRRQANWFKEDDATINWFRMAPESIDTIEAFIRKWFTRLL